MPASRSDARSGEPAVKYGPSVWDVVGSAGGVHVALAGGDAAVEPSADGDASVVPSSDPDAAGDAIGDAGTVTADDALGLAVEPPQAARSRSAPTPNASTRTRVAVS